MPRDRRLAVTTLAKDVPPGPQGQPGHNAGTEVVLVEAVQVDGLGGVSFSAPRPSELLLHEAKADLKRAVRLRTQSLSQTTRAKWTQPGIEFGFTNVPLLFDFFGTAMSGVILTYASVDARLNEFFTEPVLHEGQKVSVEQIQGYWSVEKKLGLVATRAGTESLAEEVHDELRELKELRDMVAHIRTEHIRSRHPEFLEHGNRKLLWARLLNDSELDRFGRLAERILDGLAAAGLADNSASR